MDFDTGVVFTQKKKEAKSNSMLSNIFKFGSDKNVQHKAVILHVHGGGFVSMSSGSH